MTNFVFRLAHLATVHERSSVAYKGTPTGKSEPGAAHESCLLRFLFRFVRVIFFPALASYFLDIITGKMNGTCLLLISAMD
jgi:hypothetical protein